MNTYGKYRGLVHANEDPGGLGRVQVVVPDVSADPLGWALPCIPYAPAGAVVTVPPVGSAVWVEFEGGEVDAPVWSGCFWNDSGTSPRFEPV